MQFSTLTRAPWTILSSRLVMPSGRCRPSALGMYVLRMGFARYAPLQPPVEALSPPLGGKERGIIVRRIAGQEHVGPDGEPRSVSRNTLDRCAPRGASSYPWRSWEELGGVFLGQRLTWRRKPKGTVACR
jgi:hypothetical protein